MRTEGGCGDRLPSCAQGSFLSRNDQGEAAPQSAPQVVGGRSSSLSRRLTWQIQSARRRSTYWFVVEGVREGTQENRQCGSVMADFSGVQNAAEQKRLAKHLQSFKVNSCDAELLGKSAAWISKLLMLSIQASSGSASGLAPPCLIAL